MSSVSGKVRYLRIDVYGKEGRLSENCHPLCTAHLYGHHHHCGPNCFQTTQEQSITIHYTWKECISIIVSLLAGNCDWYVDHIRNNSLRHLHPVFDGKWWTYLRNATLKKSPTSNSPRKEAWINAPHEASQVGNFVMTLGRPVNTPRLLNSTPLCHSQKDFLSISRFPC